MKATTQEADRLVALDQAGHPAITCELVDRFRRPLLAVIRRSLHRRLVAVLDPEDVLQDVWVAVLRPYPPVDNPERLPGYLVGLARHKALKANRRHLDSRKRDRRREVALVGHDAALTLVVLDGAASPQQQASARELRERASRGIYGVCGRAAVLLVEGYSHKEVWFSAKFAGRGGGKACG